PELRPGDLVVPDVVLGPAGERFATVEVAGLPRAGALAGVTDVVETPAAKARLWVETRALACDMESAVILAWARARGIPAAVIRGLLRDGRAVRVLARPGGDRRALAGLPVEIAEGDLLDAASVRRAVRGADTVFHVAADYRLWAPDPDALHRANVGGTRAVLEAAAEHGV